ncbi:uncharacterized protein LOC121732609 [Aricia agestis]|uniref:uncharacterized protein LOC121732609 n=1 Tax=Aricia agestis TaxID=91739 RepID=UPI001C20B00B|nr:uncharacterized protein LOC121732609 [Aricia agestis]
MSSDIITNLELDKLGETGKIILVKELKGCDSAFITSCVIGNCIKNKSALLIITTHNTLKHYHNVGLKMNYNLQKAVDSGLINFYDVGQEIAENVLINENSFKESIINNIKKRFESLREKYDSVNIIVDGLSHLFDAQMKLKEVNRISEEIIKLVQPHSSFLIIHCNVAASHDVTETMANLLSHKSQIVVEMESLTSGLSADVSGHLTIKRPGLRFETDNMYVMQQKPLQYLFKLFDRGVKLLAPGTV